jgi:CPA2 family monovalent cation:H+ antiporter-2
LALPIIARAHSEAEIAHLMKHGATLVVMGEHEIAKAMIENIDERDAAQARSMAEVVALANVLAPKPAPP